MKNFLLLFMSLLAAPIFKNSHFQAEIYLIFLKKSPISSFKGFQYQIWASVKRLEKQLFSKTSFITFLELSYSNFSLKLCKRTQSYQNYYIRGLGQVRSKQPFLEIILAKINETNFSVGVKQHTTGEVQFLFFNRFLLVLTTFSF